MPRRLIGLLIATALISAPAVALRAACVGMSCGAAAAAQARVPFCPLPDRLKTLIAAGYRDGRSPEVLVVAPGISGGTSPNAAGVPWPAGAPAADTSVPIVFSGASVVHGPLSPGTGLDQIAPTLADFLRFNRGHPEIRSGKPLAGLASGGPSATAVPRLILEIAWTGVGGTGSKSLPVSKTPWLHGQFRSGAGTFEGDTGSVPLDPAATLTTIGTGGLPYQHGITGSLLRSRAGAVVPTWGPGAPTSVIATLADDFDQAKTQAPKIALVAPSPEDQGLVGGKWYVGHDKDLTAIGGDPVGQARAALATGLGSDTVPDILGVVLQGSPQQMDRESSAIQLMAERAAGAAGLLTVTAGTGEQSHDAGSAAQVATLVDAAVGAHVVAATSPGGLFLDPAIQSQAHIASQDVVAALIPTQGSDLGAKTPGGIDIQDAFQGFAVSFRKYC